MSLCHCSCLVSETCTGTYVNHPRSALLQHHLATALELNCHHIARPFVHRSNTPAACQEAGDISNVSDGVAANALAQT
jgi:hypothetical protein